MDDLVKQAREALDGVTPGPWRFDDRTVFECIRDAEGDPIIYGGRDSDIVACIADVHFIPAARDLVPAMADRIEAVTAERDALAEKLAQAVELLEWYSEQSRLARLVHSGGDAGRHAIAADGGKRARAFLATIQPKGKADD